MQFRTIENGEWRDKSRRQTLFEIHLFKKISLIEFLHNKLQSIDFSGKMWLLFTKDEERDFDSRASGLLPASETRAADFLNGILSGFKECRKEGMLATYVTTNPKISFANAKPHQLRLAILFERR